MRFGDWFVVSCLNARLQHLEFENRGEALITLARDDAARSLFDRSPAKSKAIEVFEIETSTMISNSPHGRRAAPPNLVCPFVPYQRFFPPPMMDHFIPIL